MTDQSLICRCSPSDHYGFPTEEHGRDEHNAFWCETCITMIGADQTRVDLHMARGHVLSAGNCAHPDCDCDSYMSLEDEAERRSMSAGGFSTREDEAMDAYFTLK